MKDDVEFVPHAGADEDASSEQSSDGRVVLIDGCRSGFEELLTRTSHQLVNFIFPARLLGLSDSLDFFHLDLCAFSQSVDSILRQLYLSAEPTVTTHSHALQTDL